MLGYGFYRVSSSWYYIILLARAVTPDVMTPLGDTVAHTFHHSVIRRQSGPFFLEAGWLGQLVILRLSHAINALWFSVVGVEISLRWSIRGHV